MHRLKCVSLSLYLSISPSFYFSIARCLVHSFSRSLFLSIHLTSSLAPCHRISRPKIPSLSVSQVREIKPPQPSPLRLAFILFFERNPARRVQGRPWDSRGCIEDCAHVHEKNAHATTNPAIAARSNARVSAYISTTAHGGERHAARGAKGARWAC